MAYGSTELDVASATLDTWLNESNEPVDLFSTHNPLIAILMDASQEPGGDYQFKQAAVAEGNQFKLNVFGKVGWTAAGVTRANQVNALTPSVDTNLTNVFWPWTHYQGMINHNYEDKVKNSGKAQVIDLGQAFQDQISAKFFDVLGTDMMDNAAGSDTKIQSINAPLLNTGTVAGVDQSDTTNNAWWQAQVDTTSEIFTTQAFDQLRDNCTIDTGRRTGIRRFDPDIAFLYGNLYSKLRQDLKPAQRTEISDTLKGGAKFLVYDGVRCFRTSRIVANTVLVLNSTTWTFRYNTRMPDPVTPGFVPVSKTPSMWERGFNWFVGLGCYSCKHNGYLGNKTAA